MLAFSFINHIVGGSVFCGFFGAFEDLNFFSNYLFIASGIFGMMLPDIDHSKSIIGKFVPPVTRYLNRNHGHRTLTHSLLFACVTTFVFYWILFAVSYSFPIPFSEMTYFYFLGILSHDIYDKSTQNGIAFLYPFFKNKDVIGANPNKRFKTGKPQSEVLIFSSFLILGAFQQPLVEKGAWSFYNQHFGTVRHLASDFQKTRKLMRADFVLQKGSEIETGSGILIEANEKDFLVIQNGDFRHISVDENLVKRVVGIKTDSVFKFVQIPFSGISVDSANVLFNSNFIYSFEVVGNQYFNLNNSKADEFSGEFQNEFVFSEIKRKSKYEFKKSPKILSLKTGLKRAKYKFQKSKENYQKFEQKRDEIQSRIDGTDDFGNIELWLSELEELKEPRLPDDSKINQFERELNEAIGADKIRKEKELGEQKIYSDLLISGIIEKVQIVSSD